MSMCVCPVHMCRSEEDAIRHPTLPCSTYALETGFLTEPGASCQEALVILLSSSSHSSGVMCSLAWLFAFVLWV